MSAQIRNSAEWSDGLIRRVSMRPLAFTLVGLLVVLAILAMLVALLVPALGRARVAVYAVDCLARQRQLAIASFAYHADNRYYPVNSRTQLGPREACMD